MGSHLKSFYNTTLRPIYLLTLGYYRLPLSFPKKERGREGHNKKGDETSINFDRITVPGMERAQERNPQGQKLLTGTNQQIEQVREKIARTITPIGLGIKGRGPDTTVDQSPTEKTTVNNKLSGTILKSRKMTNSQLPAQPSSATMDGKNSSFLRKD